MEKIKILREERKDKTRPLSLLDGKPYTVAAQTNIRETFRKLGWIGPEEQRMRRDNP